MEKRLSLKNLDRVNSESAFLTSPRRTSSFSSLRSPRGSKTPSPRRKNACEFRSTINTSPRGGNHTINVKKIKDIGRGASGTIVYQAKIDEGMYCVKELKLNGKNIKQLKQIQDEIDLLRKLPRNSNLVVYMGYQQTPEKIQIFMGLYNGTLYDYIQRLKRKRRKLTISQIAKICKQLLKGLNVLHNRNLMHRDLKSENILYEGTPEDFDHMNFVIADLGESKIISKKSKAKTIKGTPAWIAPEVFEKGESYTFSADIWSFGMIVYEMITLKIPFYDKRFVTNAIVDGKLPKFTKDEQLTYASILPLWENCTMKNPEKRTTIENALRMIDILI